MVRTVSPCLHFSHTWDFFFKSGSCSNSRTLRLAASFCFYVQVRVPASLLEDLRVLGVKHLFEVLELCFPSSKREYILYKTYGLAES